MKEIRKILLIALFSLNILYAESDIVAVIDFIGKGIPDKEASALTDRLQIELKINSNFKIIERNKVNDILKEQGFHLSGCVSSECVVEAGQLLGANRIITGSISKIGNTYSVNTKLIDVATGEIIEAINYDNEISIEDLLKNGMKEIAQKISKYSQNVHLNNQIIDSLSTLADKLIGMGYLESAGITLDKIEEIDSGNKNVNYGRAFLLLLSGKYAESIEMFNNLIGDDIFCDECYAGRGYANIFLEKYDNASSDINISLKINPNNYVALEAKGVMLSIIGDYENAIKLFDEALLINQNRKDVMIHRGLCYVALGNFKKALSDGKKAIDINPDDPNAIQLMAMIYYGLNEANNAIEYFSRLIEINPANADNYYYRGIILNENKKNINKVIKDMKISAKLGNKDAKKWLQNKNIDLE